MKKYDIDHFEMVLLKSFIVVLSLFQTQIMSIISSFFLKKIQNKNKKTVVFNLYY